MGIFDRFSRRKAAAQKAPGITRAVVKRGLGWPVPWWRGDYTLKNSELLFAAVSRISNALSAMPIQLYKGAALVNNELNDMIQLAPNPNMTSATFFKTMEACRCTYGNCYALKIMDTQMNLVRLDVLDPGRVTPELNDDDGELWYRIQPERGQMFYVHNWYMIHIPFVSTNGYTGVNPVSVLFDTLSYAEDIQKFSREQLAKGINAAVCLEAPATLGKEQVEKAIQDFQAVYKETGGNILMLESGVTAKALNLSPVDTKLFEVEKITRGTVAMVYNLPPHLLGDYSDSSYASMEQQMIEFLTLTMLPIVTAYEQELRKKLLTPQERKRKMTFRFDMKAMLRPDARTMADVNFRAVRSGYRSPNDIRKENGEPRIPNGDTYFMSKDLVPLDFLVNNPTGTVAQPPPPKAEGAEEPKELEEKEGNTENESGGDGKETEKD